MYRLDTQCTEKNELKKRNSTLGVQTGICRVDWTTVVTYVKHVAQLNIGRASGMRSWA